MREFQAEKAQAANHQQEMAGQQQQLASEEAARQEQVAMSNEQQRMDNDNANKQLDRDHDAELTMFKETSKNEREQQKIKQQ